jgi:hypothetical protein
MQTALMLVSLQSPVQTCVPLHADSKEEARSQSRAAVACIAHTVQTVHEPWPLMPLALRFDHLNCPADHFSDSPNLRCRLKSMTYAMLFTLPHLWDRGSCTLQGLQLRFPVLECIQLDEITRLQTLLADSLPTTWPFALL